mmetsp:Transcript_56770/g.122706  ORF Transcript_56770/g.122706 Transcript_56770/m.122706 type:complete len:244 (-) Transcript_56770:149-880(-)
MVASCQGCLAGLFARRRQCSPAPPSVQSTEKLPAARQTTTTLTPVEPSPATTERRVKPVATNASTPADAGSVQDWQQPLKVELPSTRCEFDASFHSMKYANDATRPTNIKFTSLPANWGSQREAENQAWPPGLDAPPGLTTVSKGSASHGSGQCSPCAWYWKPKSCLNGQECAFCHLCSEGELKARKKQKLQTRRALSFAHENSGSMDAPAAWPSPNTQKASEVTVPSPTQGSRHVLKLSSLI